MQFFASITPLLFSLSFFWFLIAIIVFIVKLVGTGKITDPAEKKLAVKKAWNVIAYPIVFFFLVVVANSLLMIIGGTLETQ